MNQMELAARQSGQEAAPPHVTPTKEMRRKMRAQARRHREENPDDFQRQCWKDCQSKPGMPRH